MVLGDVVCAWLLLRGAEVALEKLAGEVSAKDKAFYEGKVAAAQFFGLASTTSSPSRSAAHRNRSCAEVAVHATTSAHDRAACLASHVATGGP